MIEKTEIQGVTTFDTPFTYIKLTNNTYEFLYKEKHFSSIGGSAITEKNVKDIVDRLNEAYQNGFHDCSIELMN